MQSPRERSQPLRPALRFGSWLVSVGLLCMSVAHAQAPADVRAQIAPTGTLRAGINYNNPLLATRNPQTGELRGVAVDLSRELGRRLGLPVSLIPYESAGSMGAAGKAGAWDIAFLGVDPVRAQQLDFAPPYLDIEGAYLVPAGSALRSVSDVDRPGIRIAVTAKSAYDLYLSRTLRHAALVRFANTPLSIDMLTAQKLDAVAAVRTALISGARGVPGSHVLPGHFMIIPQSVAVPKGRPAALLYLRQFMESAKASGFVARALQRYGLGPNDAMVAPPEP